ncbi:topoisomerase DNA-binding C4 zinc finger domain-containing protein, partial [Candidatus Gottesmanbacteria bacterium]|nr:topoisomerase DNA-binding C4 zinc finger domain-containing protein [Candidatus Gottesmanbacteria bacterium]
TKNIVETVGIPCPRCGADMVIKKTRRGKQFYGCSSYPKCNFAAWKKEDIK